jgi:hypothetical protein
MLLPTGVGVRTLTNIAVVCASVQMLAMLLEKMDETIDHSCEERP